MYRNISSGDFTHYRGSLHVKREHAHMISQLGQQLSYASRVCSLYGSASRHNVEVDKQNTNTSKFCDSSLFNALVNKNKQPLRYDYLVCGMLQSASLVDPTGTAITEYGVCARGTQCRGRYWTFEAY